MLNAWLDWQSAAVSRFPQIDGTLQSISLERQPLAGPINKLPMAALLLVLQFLDATSKLKEARCSRWLLHVASDSSAWLGTAPIRSTPARSAVRLTDRRIAAD